MVILSDNTFHTWLQLSNCVCLKGLPTKYRSYLLKLISNYDHFLTVSNRGYGCCYVLSLNFTRSFENAFCKCSRALNILFLFETSDFWWMPSFSAYRATLNELKQKTDINLKKVDKRSITADVEKNDRIREGKNRNWRPQQLQASRKLMVKETHITLSNNGNAPW